MKLLPTIFLDRLVTLNELSYNILATTLLVLGFLLLIYSTIFFNKGKGFFRKKRVISSILGNEKMEESAYQNALKILDRARADSLKILGRAQSKAQSVLSTTYSISKESKEKLDSNLQDMYEKQEKSLLNLTKELLESYRGAIEEGKEENIRTLYEATESMKNEALKGVSEFKDVIKKETLEARGQLEEKIKSEYTGVEEEIEAYKEERLKNLNNKIFDILANVYSEVIKQDLDQVKHEKLIISMLKDELRKSGMRKAPQVKTNK